MNKQKPKHQGHGAAGRAIQPTHWGNVADWYDALVGDAGSEFHQRVIIPGVLRLLDLNQKPKTKNQKCIMDLACGQGVLCRALADAGCDVIGIDAAEPLIAAARRRNEIEKLAIRYLIADATKLLTDAGTLAIDAKPASADAVTIVLAIQNMTPLSPIWQACRTLLKPGGALLLVMMHPCFRIPRQSDWLWQPETPAAPAAESRVIRQYLSSSKIDIQTHPGRAAHGKDANSTPHFHRPLQAYINTLGNAGLLIDHIEEWVSHKSSQEGPKKAALDRARKEIPMFLAMRAVKGDDGRDGKVRG